MLTTQIIIVDQLLQLLQLLPLLLVMPLVPLPLVLMMSHPSMIMMPPVGPAQTALAPAAGPHHGSQLTLLGCGVWWCTTAHPYQLRVWPAVVMCTVIPFL